MSGRFPMLASSASPKRPRSFGHFFWPSGASRKYRSTSGRFISSRHCHWLTNAYECGTKRHPSASSEIIGDASVLDQQTLAGRKLQDAMASRLHPRVLRQLLGLVTGPAIVVEHDQSSWDDSLEQRVERSDLGFRRVHVHVEECNAFGNGYPEALRNDPTHHLDIGK